MKGKDLSKPSVIRHFCRILNTALFALVLTFSAISAFADCANLPAGKVCAPSDGNAYSDCPEACYCPGGTNVRETSESYGVVQTQCANHTLNSINMRGAVYPCPDSTVSNEGATSVSDCFYENLRWECPDIICPEHSDSCYFAGDSYDYEDVYLPSADPISATDSSGYKKCTIEYDCETGYHDGASKLEEYYNQHPEIITTQPIKRKYRPIELVTTGYGYKQSDDISGLGLGEWELQYSFGSIKGRALCNMFDNGDNNNDLGIPVHEGTIHNAQNCWCQITHFKAAGETEFDTAISDWAFEYDMSEDSGCQGSCSYECAKSFSDIAEDLFGSLDGKNCVINTININYSSNGGSGVMPSSAPRSCTYDIGDCDTPENPYTKEGFVFDGWECSSNTGSCYNDEYGENDSLSDEIEYNKGNITLTAKWIKCPAGTYVNSGYCTACAKGSYSNTLGATECIPCPYGKTTSGPGATSCSLDCENASTGVESWVATKWNNNNVVTDLCTISTCATGFEKKDGLNSTINGTEQLYRSHDDTLRNTSNIPKGDWTVSFDADNKIVKGRSLCTSWGDTRNDTENVTGGYCYCQITGYQRNDEEYVNLENYPWIFRPVGVYDSEYCSTYCSPNFCANNIATNYELRTAAFADLAVVNYCEPTLSISLSYIDSMDNSVIETTPQMCTYNEAFNLPDAPTRSGYKFVGWELVE